MNNFEKFGCLMKKSIRYIPIGNKPFKCKIIGRWEIDMQPENDEPVMVRIYKNNNEYSDYFVVDEGDFLTTYPELERKRHMEGETIV